MVPRVLLHMPDGVFRGSMETMDIEEEDAANDEDPPDAVGDIQGFAEVRMSEEESPNGTQREGEVDDRERQPLHRLVEAKNTEETREEGEAEENGNE